MLGHTRVIQLVLCAGEHAKKRILELSLPQKEAVTSPLFCQGKPRVNVHPVPIELVLQN